MPGGFARCHGSVVGSWLRHLARLAAITIASGVWPVAAAHAQLLVEGRLDAIHIEARDVPLRQVLEALGTKYNLHYRSSVELDTPVTGTFDGSLHRVAVRVLDGYDFAMKLMPEAIDVLILRRDGKPAVIAAPVGEPVKSPTPVTTAQKANRHEQGRVRY